MRYQHQYSNLQNKVYEKPLRFVWQGKTCLKENGNIVTWTDTTGFLLSLPPNVSSSSQRADQQQRLILQVACYTHLQHCNDLPTGTRPSQPTHYQSFKKTEAFQLSPQGSMRGETTITLSNESNISMDYYCPIKDSRATTLFLVWLRGPDPCNIELIPQTANDLTIRYDQKIIILNS